MVDINKEWGDAFIYNTPHVSLCPSHLLVPLSWLPLTSHCVHLMPSVLAPWPLPVPTVLARHIPPSLLPSLPLPPGIRCVPPAILCQPEAPWSSACPAMAVSQAAPFPRFCPSTHERCEAR